MTTRLTNVLDFSIITKQFSECVINRSHTIPGELTLVVIDTGHTNSSPYIMGEAVKALKVELPKTQTTNGVFLVVKGDDSATFPAIAVWAADHYKEAKWIAICVSSKKPLITYYIGIVVKSTDESFQVGTPVWVDSEFANPTLR